MSDYAYFSNLLKFFRKDNGLSQKDMAELCGISLRHYQDLESGDALPNFNNTMYIAKVLDIDINSLRDNAELNENSLFILKKIKDKKALRP